jgi:hypothetical protein
MIKNRLIQEVWTACWRAANSTGPWMRLQPVKQILTPLAMSCLSHAQGIEIGPAGMEGLPVLLQWLKYGVLLISQPPFPAFRSSSPGCRL